MNLQTGHIELFVSDPLRSRIFYKDILEFEDVAIQNGNLVWMKKGSMEILLRPGSITSGAKDYKDSPVGFVLYTDNLPKTVAELTAKGLEFKGTVDTEKCLTFTDSDGHWFQLVNPHDH